MTRRLSLTIHEAPTARVVRLDGARISGPDEDGPVVARFTADRDAIRRALDGAEPALRLGGGEGGR